MVIRNSLDWEHYRATFQGLYPMVHAPFTVPSYPVIVISQLTNYTDEDMSNAYVHHTFYTVEDFEYPDQASEYMHMLEDFPEFLKAMEQDLAFARIQDSNRGE